MQSLTRVIHLQHHINDKIEKRINGNVVNFNHDVESNHNDVESHHDDVESDHNRVGHKG